MCENLVTNRGGESECSTVDQPNQSFGAGITLFNRSYPDQSSRAKAIAKLIAILYSLIMVLSNTGAYVVTRFRSHRNYCSDQLRRAQRKRMSCHILVFKESNFV